MNVLLGDVHDQPHVGIDEQLLDLVSLGHQFLDLVESLGPNAGRVNVAVVLAKFVAQQRRSVLQVVHLAEQMLLLVLAEQRQFIERSQFGADVLRSLHGLALDFVLFRVRHRRQDHGRVGRVLEGIVRNVFERQTKEPLCAHLVNDAIDRRTGAVIAFGKHFHGNPLLVRGINHIFGTFVERAGYVREHRLFGMFLVKIPDRIPDCFRGSPQSLGDVTTDLGQGHPVISSQALGLAQNLFALGVGHLREPTPAFDAVGMVGQEAIYHLLRKGHHLSAFSHHAMTDQSELTPAPDGLGRDVPAPTDLLNRNDGLGSIVGGQRQGGGHQPEVVQQIGPVDEQVWIRVWTEIGDAEANVLVRVLLRGVDLRQQLLGPCLLFAPLGRGRKPHLLVRQLFQCWMLEAYHSCYSLLSGLLTRLTALQIVPIVPQPPITLPAFASPPQNRIKKVCVFGRYSG